MFNNAHAALDFYENYGAVLSGINNFMNEVLFFKIFYVPFIILLLAFGYVFLTLRFRFLNIRMFKHAFAILCGKYDTNHHDGHITHFQAFVTALSSTVGLGTVAGVAIAVSMGGPGAVPWMMITGFFGMSAKFAEVTLAFRHRTTEDQEQLFSGPFQYIRNGLEEFGFKKLGVVLAAVYAVFFVLSGLGGSVAFQTNQMVSILSGYSNWVDSHPWFLSSIISALLALVIIGGIKRIARVSFALVPIMSLVYIFSCVIIIAFNIHNFSNAFKMLFSNMIDFNAVGGGVVGTLVTGIQRAIFASEAGVGSASITHAVAKDEEPVRTGLVAMIEPCFDTMLICCLTGITIVITGAYQAGVGEGILITQKAFETVSSWFPILLTIAAPLFAFSSVISFVYCCEVGWLYLFGAKSIVIYRIAVIIVAFFSGLSKDIMTIANIGGALFSCLALINMTALMLFSSKINDEVQCYLRRLRDNKIS
nr:amino acid carrier protein [Wolbachia endosymbiont of Mansonella perstans]